MANRPVTTIMQPDNFHHAVAHQASLLLLLRKLPKKNEK